MKTKVEGIFAHVMAYIENMKEDFPLVKEDWVREHQGKLDIHVKFIFLSHKLQIYSESKYSNLCGF